MGYLYGGGAYCVLVRRKVETGKMGDIYVESPVC